MKKIEIEEHKKILVEILKYINDICIENDIKYSLTGGSLIGAIRHEGIIPWDDDIDIILTHNEYVKLINVLSKINNKRYKILTHEINDSYFYPFAKLVDTKTILHEKNIKNIDDYGVYVDIFEYNCFPNNKIISKLHYNKIFFYKYLIGRYATINKSSIKISKKIMHFFIDCLVKHIGITKIIQKYKQLNNKYNSKNTNYLVGNWCAYGINKELQLKKNMDKYKIVKFENIEAMIFENYDEILKTTFGNYMELPPIEKRITHHNTEIYWKDDDNEK